MTLNPWNIDIWQLQNYTYCNWFRLNGVSSCSELPLSPKLILPTPSSLKHIEKEFAIKPSLDNMLGTDICSIPSPNKPLGAATSRNEPLCTCPQLHRRIKAGQPHEQIRTVCIKELPGNKVPNQVKLSISIYWPKCDVCLDRFRMLIFCFQV